MAHSEHSPPSPFDPTATFASKSPPAEDPGFFSKFLSRHPSTSSASSSQQVRRRSCNILTSIPDHFSTLLRSHSTSVGKSPCNQPPPITSKALFSGYADPPTFVQETSVRSSLDMPLSRSSQEEERPSRKLKSENRFYNFLTRSRSRSVSKNEQPSTEVEQTTRPMPDLPQNARSPPSSLGRRSNIPTPSQSPGTKPASRIQSRPLSSTTTATNTTITPATPKAKKRPQPTVTASPPPVASSSNPVESRSRPTTPKPSGARKKLHDLFTLPLRLSSSRSRSRSRPSSPQVSLDVPPLPTVDDDPTPRPRQSSPQALRLPPPRSPSPTPERKVLRVTNDTTTSSSTGSTAPSVKITKFFSKGSAPGPEHRKSGHQHSASGPPILPPIPSFVSAPLKRVSSLHRRSVKDPTPDAAQLGPSSLPKIIHRPPTPTKDGNGAVEGSKLPSIVTRAGYHVMKGSLDSGMRYRPPMSAVDEEGRPNFTQKDKGRAGKARDLEGQAVPRPQPIKMSSSARSTKHGSFDFERPGWGAAMMQRTGSGGTTATQNTTGSGWSGAVNRETAKERESKYGPGLAGVGTLQREASVKRLEHREELLKRERDRTKKPPLPAGVDNREKERNKDKERHTHSQQTTPSGSTSTAGTGKTSSMSKATSKRFGRGQKTASGSGISRFVGLATHHGLFSFESPIPSPTRSTGSTGTTGTAHDRVVLVPSKDIKDRELERLQAEKERQRDLRRGGRTGDRAPVPVPVPPRSAASNKLTFGAGASTASSGFPAQTNAGHRSGAKGRSLDLGLGLAWAPSKMKEEALLPSSTFFVRALSGRSTSGSTTGRSGNGGSSSGHGNANGSGSGRSRGGDDPDVERSRLGREVAEVFKNALGSEEYKLFKSYVHQFDADEIPFDGPTGIVPLVERLLVTAPHLGEEGKKRLLDNFVKIILQQA